MVTSKYWHVLGQEPTVAHRCPPDLNLIQILLLNLNLCSGTQGPKFSHHLTLFLGTSKIQNHDFGIHCISQIILFSLALDWASHITSGNPYKPGDPIPSSFNLPYLSSLFSGPLVFLLPHITWHGIPPCLRTTLLTFLLIAGKHLSFGS